MLSWHLALRYLRTRRAAWLALIAITFTVGLSILFVGLSQGWLEMVERNFRANEADLTLRAGDDAADTPQVRAKVAALPGVAAVAPFVSTYGIIGRRKEFGEHANLPCLVDGLDWSADAAMGRISALRLHPQPVTAIDCPDVPPDRRGSGFLTRAWRHHLVLSGLDLVGPFGLAPIPLPPRERPIPGVVPGREVLYGSGMRLGEQVSITVPSGKRIKVEISDTMSTGVVQTDQLAVLVPLPQAQRLSDLHAKPTEPARVTGWRASVVPGAAPQAVADRINAGPSRYEARTWRQARGINGVRLIENSRNLMAVGMVAFLVISMLFVYAVFSTLVVEKRHDIGVLKGLGARRGEIINTFLIAGVAVCLLGGVFGWALGWGLLAVINPISDLLGFPLFPQDIFYSAKAPISFNPLIPLAFIAITTVIGLLAVLQPALKAGRVDPIETLREGA